MGRAEQLADGAAQLALLRTNRRVEAEGTAENDQQHLALFQQQTVVTAVDVHTMINNHQNLITNIEPSLDILGQ